MRSGERAALAVAHGRPTVIGEAVLDPILPPLHLVVCGAGPDAGPLVASALRQGWRVDVVDPRRTWLRPDRFPGARLLDVEPAQAADAAGAGEWTAAVVMSHDYLRDAAFVGGFIGRGVTYLGILGPRDRTDRLLAELETAPSAADLAVLHAPGGPRYRCRWGGAGRDVDRRRDPGRASRAHAAARFGNVTGPIHS